VCLAALGLPQLNGLKLIRMGQLVFLQGSSAPRGIYRDHVGSVIGCFSIHFAIYEEFFTAIYAIEIAYLYIIDKLK